MLVLIMYKRTGVYARSLCVVIRTIEEGSKTLRICVISLLFCETLSRQVSGENAIIP